VTEPGSADIAWLALGSNLGHRGGALQRIRDELQGRGLVIEAASREVLTRPIGLRHQPDYHNQVLRVRSATPRTPRDWLLLSKDVEAAAGRRPTYHWGPRVADVDILYLGAQRDIVVNEPDLTVPHPEIVNRPFLSRLLAQIGKRSAS